MFPALYAQDMIGTFGSKKEEDMDYYIPSKAWNLLSSRDQKKLDNLGVLPMPEVVEDQMGKYCSDPTPIESALRVVYSLVHLLVAEDKHEQVRTELAKIKAAKKVLAEL